MRAERSQQRGKHVVWLDYASATNSLCVTGRLETTRELRQLGWQVTLVLVGDPNQRSVRNVDVLCIPMPRVYFLGLVVYHLRFLLWLLDTWSTVDLVFFHPMSAPWLLPLRFIWTLRGDKHPLLVMDTRDLDATDGSLKNRLRVLYGKFVSKLANRWADGQTAITQRMADLIQIPQDQLWGTWPSGVNLEQFSHVKNQRVWPKKGEAIHLIYIGALLKERNLLPLCQAVEMANNTDMKFTLTLVGDGSAKSELEEFSRRTAGRVQVLPPMPHDQIPGVLAKAHVGVTSLFNPEITLFQASSPIKLFEYMAAGLAILATRMPCHSDVIGNGNYSFWVNNAQVPTLYEALRTIWHSRSSLSEMGFLAAAAASEWTWQESAEKLQTALEYGLARYQ